MSMKIEYSDDRGRGLSEVQGSDGRLNVSTRSDSRAYYNSRDTQLTFALSFLMTLADTGEHFVAWRNASDDKDLVIRHLDVAVFEPVDLKWHIGTGTPAAGTIITPVNMNQGASRPAPTDAAVSAMEGTTTTPLTGLTSAGVVNFHSILSIQDSVHVEFDDVVRLGPNGVFFGEMEAASTPGFVQGTITGYYE